MSETNTEMNAAAQYIESPLVSLQETMNPKTGKLERIHANLPCIYPNARDELCFAEVMARHRGWVAKDWSKERQIAPRRIVLPQSGMQLTTNRLAIDAGDVEEQDVTSNVTKDISREDNSGKPRRKKTIEVKGETQTGQ